MTITLIIVRTKMDADILQPFQPSAQGGAQMLSLPVCPPFVVKEL